MKQVSWVKNNQNGSWFDFLRLNLDATYFAEKKGVYVIWYSAPGSAKVIRVGSGLIGARLREQRANSEITKFSSLGQLKVAWFVVGGTSEVKLEEIENVEAYLARVYSPLVSDRSPSTGEVEVSLLK